MASLFARFQKTGLEANTLTKVKNNKNKKVTTLHTEQATITLLILETLIRPVHISLGACVIPCEFREASKPLT